MVVDLEQRLLSLLLAVPMVLGRVGLWWTWIVGSIEGVIRVVGAETRPINH